MLADYFFYFLIGFISAIIFLALSSIKLWVLVVGIFAVAALFWIIKGRFFSFVASFTFGFLFAVIRTSIIPIPIEFFDGGFFETVKEFLAQLSQAFALHFQRLFPEPVASFSQGIITGGENVRFSKDFYEALRKTSTLHLIAVSGYNITVIAGNIYRFLELVTFPRKFIWLVVICAIGLFVIFVGAPASAVRAGIMGAFVVVAQRFYRMLDVRNLFAFCLALMLFFDPLFIFDLGFQLSFLATFGIIYLAPFLFWRWGKETSSMFKITAKKIAVETLSSQLMVFPIIWYRFNMVSLFGMLANFVILPLLPLAMLLSFFAAFSLFVNVLLARILVVVSFPLLFFITRVITLFAQVPFASFSGFRLPLWFVFGYYGVVFFLVWNWNQQKQVRPYLIL